jgi:hypothetical protein
MRGFPPGENDFAPERSRFPPEQNEFNPEENRFAPGQNGFALEQTDFALGRSCRDSWEERQQTAVSLKFLPQIPAETFNYATLVHDLNSESGFPPVSAGLSSGKVTDLGYFQIYNHEPISPKAVKLQMGEPVVQRKCGLSLAANSSGMRFGFSSIPVQAWKVSASRMSLPCWLVTRWPKFKRTFSIAVTQTSTASTSS